MPAGEKLRCPCFLRSMDGATPDDDIAMMVVISRALRNTMLRFVGFLSLLRLPWKNRPIVGEVKTDGDCQTEATH